MADIVCNDIYKGYGGNHILEGITFEIYEGERAGLLGKNGAGKTTLFKILNGSEPYEKGNVFIPKTRNVEVLDQIPVFPERYSVRDVLMTGFEKLLLLQAEMKKLEIEMSGCPGSNAVKHYGELQMRFEALGGYDMETNLSRICTGLLINAGMLEKPFYKLSGGEQTRVNLGRIILKKPDILLLDEPTNHLDIKSVEWLEAYLNGFKGTVMVISHDRYFLDRVVTRIVEIVQGKAVLYKGNYSFYIKEREERLQKQLAQYEQEQRKLQQLEEAAKRMHDWANRADSHSLHKRAFAMEKRMEWIQKTDRPLLAKDIQVKFQEKSFSGREIIKIKNIEKSYGGQSVLKDISLTVNIGDRIALYGPNGCGKTTLLNLIVGRTEADGGEIKTGRSVRYAFLPQIIRFDRTDLNMLDTVRYALEWSEETARNRLAAFHFTGEEVFKPIHALSGGEKSRLKLFLLMQDEINLLILDEPTNHLDIASREWIERAVEAFNGTLLFVSHDRYFVKRFASRIWEMENGRIIDYSGTYEAYRQWKESIPSPEIPDRSLKSRQAIRSSKRENPKVKQKRLAAVEQEIMKTESKVQDITNSMEQAASNYEILQELMEKKAGLDREMEKLYEEWNNLMDG